MPYITLPPDTHSCQFCGATSLTSLEISFKRCAACSAAFYCSVECQRAAWKARPTGKGHKQICFQQALQSQEDQTAARAAPDLVSLSTAFNKYLTSVQAPLRSMIDSAMRAQEGEAALMPTHYLTASLLFDSQSPPQDQFDLLTIDLRPRSSAPELHQNTFNSSQSPNAVFLISTIVNTGGKSGKGAGMTLGFVNIFELKPYAEMGFESFPYDEAWREGFMSEVNGEGNPYDDYMLVVLQRINEEATSAVDRKRAEIALRDRYPTAKPQLWKTQQYSEEEIKEAERLGGGRALSK